MEVNLGKFKNKTICAAVSGGVDSMALLHLLKTEQEKFGYRLIAVNFEHGIRGEESKKDSLFVAKICRKWNVPLLQFAEDCLLRAETEKQSLETAARNFRLEHYENILKRGVADVIATAHHANDVAETVLFRICRGASLTGASGIRESDCFIRPLLRVTKAEILEYAEKKKIPYREDSTNFERCATRNILRLDVLPLLEQSISGAVDNLSRFSTIAAEDDEFLYELSEELLVRTEKEILVRFCEKKPIFRRACLTAMKGLKIEKDYTFTHLEDLYHLQGLKVGARLTLPCGVEAKKTETGVSFYLRSENNLQESESVFYEEIPLTVGVFSLGKYRVGIEKFPPQESAKKVLKLDLDKLPQNCVIRSRKEGDIFRKFGGGTKSLKRYLIDKKIPQEAKNVPLLCEDNGNKVYAIFGLEISEDVKVDADSKNILYLSLE